MTENVERIKTSPFHMSRANTLEVDEYLTESEFLYFFFFKLKSDAWLSEIQQNVIRGTEKTLSP